MIESPALIDQLRRAGAIGHAMAGESGERDDDWLARGLAPARLHEVFAADVVDGAGAVGFALAMALAAGAAPLLWIRTEAAERQGGRLHAGGLCEMGFAVDALLLVVVADEAALLRTAADAARCPGLGAVLIESHGRAPGIDLTATRRLMLAAEASGVTVLSVRVGAQPVPSSAATRWAVAPVPSAPLAMEPTGQPAFGQAPGQPAFAVELLRRRGGAAGGRWQVEWNRDGKCFVPLVPFAAPAARDRPAPIGGGREALSGAVFPVVVGGPAARDAPAPVRRAG